MVLECIHELLLDPSGASIKIFQDSKVNALAADALASYIGWPSCNTGPSAIMVTMHNKQVFNGRDFNYLHHTNVDE